jgi:hypothetical protein
MPNLEFTIFTYASALRPPLLLEANASTATGGATHSWKWQTSASTSVGTHGNTSMPTTMSKMSRTSKNSVNSRHCRQVQMQNLSPRFPQAIFWPKHFSSAMLQQSSTWQTEATTASLNYSIQWGVLDNQEFGNLMQAHHNIINTNLKYSKHFKPLTGSSFGRERSKFIHGCICSWRL